MTVKKSTLALATALAACFVGCEWTGSDESDSWSSAYDAMNFSGTYRAVTTAAAVQQQSTTETTDTTTDKEGFKSTSQSGGAFPKGANIAQGQTAFGNLVEGSVQVSAGGYVWNDDGSGNLVFTNPNSGSQSQTDQTSYSVVPKQESVGKVEKKSQEYPLTGSDVVPGSVVVQAGGYTFQDNGSGVLVLNGGNAASGTVAYDSGSITLTFSGSYPSGKEVTASYKYMVSDNTQVVVTTLTGSGKVQYYSGAWSVQINPAVKDNTAIVVHYSYYEENSEATTPIKPVNPGSKSGNDVTALTVSQNGQNLTITLNNGVVMSGKFTNVQQTGKVNQDTNAGYNTYNAQFQVQNEGNRFVGSLNYDLSNGYRMLNGTWTSGKNTWDVQAVGPAWLNSADASTLSPGVITK